MIVPTFVSFTSIVLIVLGTVNGQSLRNITIYNTDPAITYVPMGSWRQVAFDGHVSSTDINSNATFTFTGVAVYYVMSLGVPSEGDVSTLLTLDSGPSLLLNLSGRGDGSESYAVRWSSGALNNTNHTLVNSLGLSSRGEMAHHGEVGRFIYTVQDPYTIQGPHPEGNPINITSNDPRIIYKPPGAWTTNSTDVPSCALSGKSGVRVTSTQNATSSFKFTGRTVFIHTINSPEGGQYSVSVNGGAERLFATYATSTECGTSPPIRVPGVRVRRDVLAAQPGLNSITTKCFKPKCVFDGYSLGNSSTTKPSLAYRSISINGKFCAGAIQFISYILLYGFF